MARSVLPTLALGLLLALPCAAWSKPPPHAPAHGYRHKHSHGVDLVFDSGFGAYVVVDLPDHFFFGGHFYRHLGDHWEKAGRIGGSWSVVVSPPLPHKLLEAHKPKLKIKRKHLVEPGKKPKRPKH